MSSPRDVDRVIDMFTHAHKLRAWVREHSASALLAVDHSRWGIERAIEIIGEAAAHVSEDTREEMLSLPWHKIVGTRNIIVHGYAGLDPAKIQAILDDELDPLINTLEVWLESRGIDLSEC